MDIVSIVRFGELKWQDHSVVNIVTILEPRLTQEETQVTALGSATVTF